jgi:SAM-dependent methyltransferase
LSFIAQSVVGHRGGLRSRTPAGSTAAVDWLARELLWRSKMPDLQYFDRVRTRLAAGELSDVAFGALLPPPMREKSAWCWTPIAVARRAASRFAEHGIRRVLDVGCGPGKFCIAAGLARPDLDFFGIDRGLDLIVTARAVAASLRVSNVEFKAGNAVDARWHDFDGFYFFNPFSEGSASGSESSRADTDLLKVVELLGAANRGAVVISYHGLGGAIPSTYDLLSEEPVGSGQLRVWVKNRAREAAWYHLDYAHGVSRVPRRYFERRQVALPTSSPPSAGAETPPSERTC